MVFVVVIRDVIVLSRISFMPWTIVPSTINWWVISKNIV